MRKFLLFLLLILPFLAPAQVTQPAPRGYFLQDSVKIGTWLEYVLVYRHPLTQEVIFPDTTYNFAPFELVKKTYYPTSSDSIKSTDSTVYILRTFETDKVQKLSLPVYILRGRDTLTLYTSTDSVLLHELVHEVSEPLVFQQNTELAYVKERFNYPYFL
ncbi:MAG: hypothetical protein LPK19_01880, partial [Hymenobacteraceae bacterium]|nr:hypothetical protein [Hymenobacteraceae bacterium]MDX5394925.1 hypothetical protein [Hymenobacteraceae bacterium]MDX5510960.1 hypothetical protein [Hymenobacteraceae bacterium]